MRLITRCGTLVVGGLVLGLACKDAAAPVTPAILGIAGGDGQSGAANSALTNFLTVGVIGSDSQPFAGATVVWAVSVGVASLNPTSSVTDTNGLASTIVTLGAVAGPVTITATVAGIAPVSFSATVLTACTTGVSYTLGTPINGDLALTDCAIGKFYADLYAMNLPAQTSVTITEASATFDTFLELYSVASLPLAGNDDYGTGTDSRIKAFLAAGDYFVAPSSFDTLTTGAYTMTSDSTPATLDACEDVWATRGVTFSDTVSAADCLDSSGPYYSDRVLMFLESGTVLTAHEVSTDFDSYLILFDLSTPFFDFNDDSAAGVTNSYLVTTIPHSGIYLLDIGTFDVADTGAYTFEISSSVTAATASAASAAAAAARAPRVSTSAMFPRAVKMRRALPAWGDVRRAKRHR